MYVTKNSYNASSHVIAENFFLLPFCALVQATGGKRKNGAFKQDFTFSPAF